MKRSAQSKAAHLGNKAEAHVDKLHEACLVAGVARVRFIPTPMRLQRVGGGELRAVHTEKQGCDCLGHTLTKPGRPVAVEIKRHGGFYSKPVRHFYTNCVTEAERDDLEACLRVDGIAVLLILTQLHTYAVPWTTARDVQRFTLEELAPHLVTDAAYLRRFCKPAT